jgi:hypothetical protein
MVLYLTLKEKYGLRAFGNSDWKIFGHIFEEVVTE